MEKSKLVLVEQGVPFKEIGGPQLKSTTKSRHRREIFLVGDVMEPHRVPQHYVSILNHPVPALRAPKEAKKKKQKRIRVMMQDLIGAAV